ncbi:MAG TPA: multicopper oxidase domain-containing protein [Gemmatimonadales bacterium]|nr:multicopper oxidase domain-containing protein [Gemmatimonadales bacterium]
MSFRIHSLLATILALGCADSVAPSRRILSNDNLVPAGQHADGAQDIHLEIGSGDWFPEGDSGLSEPILAFAEQGKPLQIPGPMVRVPAGTLVRAAIDNHATDTLVIHGLGGRGSNPSDSIVVPPNGTGSVEFSADSSGTWFYWAAPPGKTLVSRGSLHTQLSGALVVDPPGTAPNADRVFVLSEWNQPIDSAGPKPWVPRDLMTINGRMWPYTERFTYTQGDSVHWRWVNASKVNHPMHLHGFYFDVRSKGTWERDTAYRAEEVRKVVTETLTPGQTMTMAWRAEQPGHWLFHCHFAFHVSHFLSLHRIPDPTDPGGPDGMEGHQHVMAGLVLGLEVKPAAAGPPTDPPPVRRLRITPRELPANPEERYHYYVQGDGVAPEDSAISTLVLRRGEPVQITIVNRLRAPTAIHWHGIELTNSYVDGVPGWSGSTGKPAPAVAPGDSFTVSFTPPRAGTFMYHSHANEVHQIAHGMYGALLVTDQPVDTAAERLFILNGDEDDIRWNGTSRPRPVGMIAGRTYRVRLINLHAGHTFNISLESGAARLRWRPVAKDGADLPSYQRQERAAVIFMGPGESADFEVTPSGEGALQLLARVPASDVKLAVPVAVRGAR